MAKRIKVIVQATLELPDNAEVIRFRDEAGIETDHIKFLGKLFRPDIGWMQYTTSDMSKEKHPGSFASMGWESVDDHLYDTYFINQDFEEWYLEEL